MLDLSHIPAPYGAATVENFTGNSVSSGASWQMWQKPRGKTMAHILLVGCGGPGGNSGSVGSARGGNGGGGSGAQASIMVPLWAIPDVLFLSLGYGLQNGSVNSLVSIAPNTTGNNCLVYAGGGGTGATSVTTAAGAAGAAGTTNAASMPLGWQWVDTALAGQAGTTGGVGTTTGSNGGTITLPLTGLLVTGGSGGGACPTTVGTGTSGGPFTSAGVFPAQAGSLGGAGTAPPAVGSHGYRPITNLLYGYGGTGGGGVGSNATGAGLVGANGGDGAPGCGGGGAGGCFTGSTLGIGGRGGPAFCQIICW